MPEMYNLKFTKSCDIFNEIFTNDITHYFRIKSILRASKFSTCSCRPFCKRAELIISKALKWKILVTANKRSLRSLSFYTCLSVILFTGGGLHPGGPASREGLHPGGFASGGSGQTPPPHQILWDTVNERAVRILLEYILVYFIFSFVSYRSKSL